MDSSGQKISIPKIIFNEYKNSISYKYPAKLKNEIVYIKYSRLDGPAWISNKDGRVEWWINNMSFSNLNDMAFILIFPREGWRK